jgi:hypothetical protein
MRKDRYVSDIVDGITELLFAEPTNTQGEPEIMGTSLHPPINLGNPYQLSVLELSNGC